MKTKQKAFLMRTAIVLIMIFCSPEAWAQNSGYCGDPNVNGGQDVTWVFDSSSNTLIISGTGNMRNFARGNTPWNNLKNLIYFVLIESGVTRIGEYAFEGCESLTSINIPESVTRILYRAFYYCTSLTSINIPESVTSIKPYAFEGCESLTSINIPESVTSIEGKAFYGCSGLTSINIPASVTYLGDEAFANCRRLSDIYISSTMPTYCGGVNTFASFTLVRDKYDVYDYAVLHVPMGTKEKYASAYEWRYFKKIKEDLEINGQVFYTTLSVNQAGEGYVQHYVKADEPYTIFIGSDEGLRINTVMFNGEDVTEKLIDGYFTTPNITRPSKISISFEQSIDNVKAIVDDNLHVYGNDGSLYVAGVEGSQEFSVYSLDGKIVEKRHIEGGTKITLNDGIYIVKVGERTFKVSV